MARNKKNQTNIDLSDPVNFPDGRIKNNDGSGNGTPVNEQVYGDIHEAFAKLMRLALLSYNNLPENETKGYQYIEALIALASKNDYIESIFVLGTTGKVGTTVNLDRLKLNESFVFLSSINITAETILSRGTGGQTAVGTQLNINFKGTTIKSGDYVRFVKTASGCDLIRLADGATFDLIATTLNYLKAASQGEEDAGAITTKASTPLTNFTAFANRVIGAASGDFLVSALNNGLMSIADFDLLHSLSNPERNYGTFGPFDVDTGSVNDLYTRTGDIIQAKIVQRTGNGQVVEITLANEMVNNSYEVRTTVESLGTIELDNDIHPLVFKIISTTKVQIYFEETTSGAQAIKIHLAALNR